MHSFQCGNYGIGGHYFIHPDYHPANPSNYFAGATGNRVATVMTVLESPEAGGATVWPYARISVFPEKGAGVYWRNVRAVSRIGSSLFNLKSIPF